MLEIKLIRRMCQRSKSKIIAEMIANLLNDVCKVENTSRDSIENRRRRDKRKIYTNEFKYQVILEASSDASLYDIDFTEKYEISKSLIAK